MQVSVESLGALERRMTFSLPADRYESEVSGRLREISRPACLRAKVLTSGRRWETQGVWRTVWLMWRLRYAYWRGVAPERLAELYR